ncbi:hypothetical protein E4T39_06691 [Aureobasidium subglaciale]|nr:hypothetical protein E4T39_06691 [Aureobasidium subglaciale]
MWVHTNCSCRTCAGRNTRSGRSVSPLTLSFNRRISIDSPPSPHSPILSISSDFDLPSPESPYLIPTNVPLSPVSPISPLASLCPTSEYSTAPPSPALSITELTAGDFPSPATPITGLYVWDVCVIPSVRADFSVFAPYWRVDASKPFSFPSQVIKEEEISPCTSLDAPALPPRPEKRTSPKRPERSPGMKRAFSWNTVNSAIAKAGPCSGAAAVVVDTIAGAEKKPSMLFTNTPWWTSIPPVSPPDSPAEISL